MSRRVTDATLVCKALERHYDISQRDASLVFSIIAQAIHDAAAIPTASAIRSRRSAMAQARPEDRDDARAYLWSSFMEYHAGLIGLDAEFIRDTLARMFDWARDSGQLTHG